VSFSATQSAASPTFDSSLVFQAAGGASVDCANLKTASTALWAVLAQDGVALSFTPGVALPIIPTVVPAPTAVTAQPSDQGMLVSWTPPADASQVAGYQVLCLPRPSKASTAGYESCGLDANAEGSALLTAADQTQVCSAPLSASNNSIRLSGLVNGTSYQVAVIALDASGGTSALSPVAEAIPQTTTGFYEKYKEAGGAATGCALVPGARRAGWCGLAAILLLVLGRRRSRCKEILRILFLLSALNASARAEDWAGREVAREPDWPERTGSNDWPGDSRSAPIATPPNWGFELGVSLYRPAVDSELSNGAHPYADTFGSSRHVLSEVEVSRYLGHRYGTWGLGLRGGYYKVNGRAFLSDGITRSGDDTSLRLIPFSLSALFRADQIPGLKRVPLIPYVKAGLDGATWTASRTGAGGSHSGFTPGWHVAAGLALGLNFLGLGSLNPGAVADPCALFFEWDYAAINGLGTSGKLHVGDNTWFAGVMFDI
ncbi:MAG TPA: fibronectin type III domain-containing protein, partial [Polyangia bacterium]